MSENAAARFLHKLYAKEDERDADEWLRSLPRKERRKLLRHHGLSRGFLCKGGRPCAPQR